MILANTLAQLTRRDAQLVIRLVARDDGEARARAEGRLADDGLEPLLDDPRVLEGLLRSPWGTRASLPLLCFVLVRHAMLQTGDRDRRLADYVASLVLQFGLRDRARRLRPHDDSTFETLVAIGAEAESADATRAFLARAHLGNYALWLSGLFPDHIERRSWHRGGPDLRYYEDLGQRGFRMAADHRLASEHGLSPVYEAAADRFPGLRQALNRLSDRLLFPHVHTPERLMRQVRDGT